MARLTARNNEALKYIKKRYNKTHYSMCVKIANTSGIDEAIIYATRWEAHDLREPLQKYMRDMISQEAR